MCSRGVDKKNRFDLIEKKEKKTEKTGKNVKNSKKKRKTGSNKICVYPPLVCRYYYADIFNCDANFPNSFLLQQ